LNTENGNIIHNQEATRFELSVDGHQAVLEYMRKGERIVFTHTRVPPAIEGRGLGTRLVEAGLNFARENGLKVKSLCWFVSKYIRLHPEYEDLLYKPQTRE
jgi:predicted GNAT family acetyltransferase